MSRFLNRWECNNREYSDKFISPVGTGIVPELKKGTDLEGTDIAVKKGDHDLYAEIQSFKDDTDLKKVMDMLGVTFKDTIDVTEEVIDLTRVPSSLGDWHNFQRDIDDYWRELPVNVRSEMNNNIQNLPEYLDHKVNEHFKQLYNAQNPQFSVDKIESAPAKVGADKIVGTSVEKVGETNGD